MNTPRAFAPLVAAIGLVGTAGFGLLYRRHEAENRSLRAVVSRIETLETAIDSLERDVRGLNTAMMLKLTAPPPDRASGATVTDNIVPSAPQAPAPHPPDPERQAEEQRARDQERLDGLNRVLNADPRDPAWASGSEQAVRTALQSLTGSKLGPIECRSHLCRIEVTHDDPAAEAMFATQFPSLLPSLGAAAYAHRQTADGRTVTTAFLAANASVLAER